MHHQHWLGIAMTLEHDNSAPESKSARKREAERLQDIGKRLSTLSLDKLEHLDLPSTLRAALTDFHRFNSHGAQRRQLQFIGKLMRKFDTQAIEDQLATLDGESAQARYQFNQLEQWRDRLITDANALTEFIQLYPLVDRQHLRQLLKKVNSADDQHRRAHAKQLFKFLRETMENS